MTSDVRQALQAAALRYDPEADDAPRLIAAGEGLLARRIIERAKQHGVPVVQDPHLAHSLVRLKVGQQVPTNLYVAIAKVLTFVYAIEQKQAGKSTD